MIKKAALLVSVNTGPVHLASGFQVPVVVLYAQTNPQHTPWKTRHRILEYSIPENLKSRNEIIRYVNKTIYNQELPLPDAGEIILAMESLMRLFMPETSFPDEHFK